MCCRNVVVDGPLDTGPLHAFGAISTRSGSGSENAPLTKWLGSDTESAASPAVEMTLAGVDAVYSCATPGVNAPNEAAGPSVSDSVAGTLPPTVPDATVHVAVAVLVASETEVAVSVTVAFGVAPSARVTYTGTV